MSTPNLKQPVAQLSGNDEYTKSLMNRVATGEATAAERFEFNMHVMRMQSQAPPRQAPSLEQDPFNMSLGENQESEQRTQPIDLPVRTSAGVSTTSYPAGGMGGVLKPDPEPSTSLEDLQVLLMRLEQQNRKRLYVSRQEVDEKLPETSMQTEGNAAAKSPVSSDGGNQRFGGLTQQDYEHKLMILNNEHKKRIEGARAELGEQSAAPAPKELEVPAGSNIQDVLDKAKADHAHQDYQLQLMLLEQQNQRRLAMARAEQQPGQSEMSAPIAANAAEGLQGSGSSNNVSPEETLKLLEQQNNARLQQAWRWAERQAELAKTSIANSIQGPTAKRASQRETLKNAESEVMRNTPKATRKAAEIYCKPFCDFMTKNPTVFHAVDSQKKELLDAGYEALDERKKWDMVPGGKYFVERNGSSLLAFSVGENYKAGNGCASKSISSLTFFPWREC